jgi:RHS repeat-associated protein
MQVARLNYFKTHDRYLYQGSEMDKEVKGDGNSYTTTFRQLDPRLGRWMTIDPVIYSWQSPYCSMNNNPLYYNDILGLYGSEKTAKRKQRKAERKFGEDKVGDVYDRNKGKEGQKPNYGFQVFGEGKDDKTRVSLDSDGDPIASAYTPDAVIDNDKDLRNFTNVEKKKNTNSSFENINNGLGIGLGVQSELLTYSIAQNYKTATNNYSYSKLSKSQQTWRATNTLGKSGTNLLKVTKVLGVIGGTYSIVSKSAEIYDKGVENMTVRDGADLTVAITGTAAAVFMSSNPIGWGIGLGCLIYSAGTMIYDASTEK